MSGKTLPAYLQQVLENHIEQSDLVRDKELEDIFSGLTRLNDNVERLKSIILKRREEADRAAQSASEKNKD
ncbi:hypothetical protein [Lacimicrobium alkaliphilum]|uniref:Uncharacterized protein n=1 Tax=Lacimicrobium alkaliphilum TaxID=1526571 RepID=A0A0U3AYG3_9ALTE|nr:hypothetical protein [Lacimicrobium alkaliphilum]ALS97920.1 hypothetical protein AT746_06325 [Lacimicrobium alkaliphilum]